MVLLSSLAKYAYVYLLRSYFHDGIFLNLTQRSYGFIEKTSRSSRSGPHIPARVCVFTPRFSVTPAVTVLRLSDAFLAFVQTSNCNSILYIAVRATHVPILVCTLDHLGSTNVGAARTCAPCSATG